MMTDATPFLLFTGFVLCTHIGLGSRVSLQRLIMKERRQKQYVSSPSAFPPFLQPPSKPSSTPFLFLLWSLAYLHQPSKWGTDAPQAHHDGPREGGESSPLACPLPLLVAVGGWEGGRAVGWWEVQDRKKARERGRGRGRTGLADTTLFISLDRRHFAAFVDLKHAPLSYQSMKRHDDGNPPPPRPLPPSLPSFLAILLSPLILNFPLAFFHPRTPI